MKTDRSATADAVRQRLIEAGGRISQDLGLGRIVGQILLHLYLQEGECSLDQIGIDLGLSKAAVSIAVRQLESLGLVRRVWKRGDRRNYYRSADNIGMALQQGLLAFIRQRLQSVGGELDQVHELLESAVRASDGADRDLQFVHGRVKRAKKLRDRASGLLDNPILKLFARA